LTLLLHLKAALMGIVEGLTEFLPVSSTGHLIVAGELLKFDIPGKEVFIVAIQAPAILAVCWHYRERLVRMALGMVNDARERKFALNIAIAFLPAAALGVLLKSAIEKVLFKPLPVACAFIVGGIIILLVEHCMKNMNKPSRVATVDDMTWTDAAKIGAAQCFALIPGTSRSGATIVGALLTGLSRKAAAEFSFFLAIPTVIGATVWSLFKARHDLALHGQYGLYLVAFAASFLSALACVRWFLRYVGTHDFRPFAYYRMAFGVVILLVLKSMAGSL
jgi:undecaprenyl-diphosphatase